MSNYTTTTNKLKITELDFDAIKTALKSYLVGQEEFKDYNFEGSAMSILLDVLAYNTHYNGFYTNMLASEMFMDSATLRSSIVSLAKHLGYTPASKKGSVVYLDLVFEGAGSLLTIPKGAKFTTKIGSDVHTFLTTQAHTASLDASDGKYKALNVEVKEGVSFVATHTVTAVENQVFQIPNEDVDTTTLSVAAGGEVYTLADDITEVTSTSKVFFLQEGNQNRYEIYFGDGIIGKKPSVSDVVQISYNASMLGSDGNGATSFFLAESVTGATSVAITLSTGWTRSSGGAERESTSSIKIQAPRQHALQKRLVTKNDYRTRLENDYNLVDSVRVWGGEENFPPDYGSVYISIKPKTGYVVSRGEQDRIAQDIIKKRNITTVRPVFVDPDYTFVIVDTVLAYDPRKTTRTADQLKVLVKNTISNYNTANLGRFDEYFRYSLLSKKIDDTEVGIMNNTTTVAMKKRIRPLYGVESSYRINFHNPIYRPHDGHMHVIQSTGFRYRGIDNCYIIDKDSELMVVSGSVEEENSALDTVEMYNGETYAVINSLVGHVDYDEGILDLEISPTRSIVADQPNGVLDMSRAEVRSEFIYFSAKPKINDILAKENTIITIDSSDVTVTCIDDTDRINENKTRSY